MASVTAQLREAFGNRSFLLQNYCFLGMLAWMTSLDAVGIGKPIKGVSVIETIANLTEGHIDSIAPSSGAAANGKSIAKKGEFATLNISSDKSLVFGEIAGSGENPYMCSMDFAAPAGPAPRCNCPSRQIPCKHVLGLLYAYAQGQVFVEAEIPQDVKEKRAGAAKRAASKKANKGENRELSEI